MGQDKQDDAFSRMHAVILGVGDGINQAVKSRQAQASSLIEPGDQRHIPHPLDDFSAGVSGAWQELTEPSDMNISHSAHPVDSLIKAHGALVSTTADNFYEKGLAQGLREFSAFATMATIENVDPFRKINTLEHIADIAENAVDAKKVLQTGGTVTPLPIDWNTYEHLLGYGSQPPKLRPLRDFSDLMHYEPPRYYDVTSRLTYVPDQNNKIVMNLEHHWDGDLPPNITHTALDFVVRSDQKLWQEHGNGPEMFHSALHLIQGYGDARIDRIDGEWSKGGDLATNYDAFESALRQGATVKEAISRTPTGRWASDAGFTEVGGEHFNNAVRAEHLPDTLYPEFKRPAFSDHEAYNTYGNAWASSQGRSRVELLPRDVKPDEQKKLGELGKHFQQLSEAERQVIMKRILANFEQHVNLPAINIDSDLK